VPEVVIGLTDSPPTEFGEMSAYSDMDASSRTGRTAYSTIP
jgi:hypothetical protein